MGEKVLSGMQHSARFRRIPSVVCSAVLMSLFWISGSCMPAWAASQQPSLSPSMNAPSDSLTDPVGYAEAGKWKRAASLLRPYVKTHPGQEEGWLWLGYSEIKLHQFATATVAFRQAAKIAPQDAKAYYHHGLSFLELGRPYKAYQAWITTLTLDPDNKVVAYFIGPLMVDAGHLTEAEKWVQRVDSSSPMSYHAEYYQGFCNGKLGRSNEAIRLYRESLQRCIITNKAYSAPYTRLAKVLIRMKRDSEAENVLQEGARRAPDGNLLTTYAKLLIHSIGCHSISSWNDALKLADFTRTGRTNFEAQQSTVC